MFNELCRRRCLIAVSVICTCAAAAGVWTVAIQFDVDWFTIDGGGVMRSTGGDFELSGTIGQPDAGVLEGGGFVLTGGFWFGLSPCDCNEDGGINLYDYSAFEACFSGPDGILPDSTCACFDLDSDGDVDLLDFSTFQRLSNGT